jgi:hypothetical protein
LYAPLASDGLGGDTWWKSTGMSRYRLYLRAHGRRIAVSDVDALAGMTGLPIELDKAIGRAVSGPR